MADAAAPGAASRGGGGGSKASPKAKVNRHGQHQKKQKQKKKKRPVHSKLASKKDGAHTRREVDRNEQFIKSASKAVEEASLLQTEEAGYLEAEGPLARTFKFTQEAIAEAVDLSTKAKIFDLELKKFGPYRVKFSRDGRNLLLCGGKGHVASIDALTFKLGTEIHLRETCRDVQYLQNSTMFAVAQKKYVYIYDATGAEVHCLKKHVHPLGLEYLPYHFLIASVGKGGFLKYQDISTGALIAEHRTKLGACSVMRQNPRNAVMCLGHNNGTVTMWTPNMSTPVVRMFCHDAPVQALAVDREGRYLATAGLDGLMKVWDVRKFQKLHSYHTSTPAASLDISQRGLLAVSAGSEVQVWKDALRVKAQSPYMSHRFPGKRVCTAVFRPYEDILGVGHDAGICSMVVPGSGEPNYDAFEANPYETKKQRREGGVQKLLDQLPPDTIIMDPEELATVDRTPQEVLMRERRLAQEAMAKGKVVKVKNKARGRNKIGKKLNKAQGNIVTLQKEKLIAKIEQQRQKREQDQAAARRKKKKKLQQQGPGSSGGADAGDDDDDDNPLGRFKKRRIPARP